MSEEWDNLTDVTKANILELIGGKRNANVVSSLLENFELAEDVLKTSAKSAGSALAENEKYLDSIQGKISQFQAAWQSLSATVVNSTLVKTIVSIGTAIVSAIDSVLNAFDGLGGVLTGISIVDLVSKLKPVADVLKSAESAATNFAGGAK